MYAFALILDDDCLTAYSAVSTTESLKKIHKIKNGMLLNGVSVLAGRCKRRCRHFYQTAFGCYRKDIVPLFQQGFDYASERQKSAVIYRCSAHCQTGTGEKYGNVVEEMAFI